MILLFEADIRDQGLLNWKTVCEWNKIRMGPINDQCGVEQINSSDYYKVYNNEQLQVAQDSECGVNIGPVTISSISQADDVALISNAIYIFVKEAEHVGTVRSTDGNLPPTSSQGSVYTRKQCFQSFP
jgi:hypothetical protein